MDSNIQNFLEPYYCQCKIQIFSFLEAYVIKSKLAPNFLLPILQEVVLAGKSVEMLQSLGRLKAIHDGQGPFTLNDFISDCDVIFPLTFLFWWQLSVLYLGPSHNHFLEPLILPFRIWAHLVFHGLQPSTGWSPICVLTSVVVA